MSGDAMSGGAANPSAVDGGAPSEGAVSSGAPGGAWDWQEALRLPEAALLGGRALHKTDLVRRGGLTRADERALKRVEAVRQFAAVQRSTCRIPPVRTGEHDVQAVVYLEVELRAGAAAAEVAAILHKALPNPTAVLMEAADGRIGVGAAVKRLSLAERGATVVEEAAWSGLFQPGDARYADYLSAIAYPALDQADLLAYARSLVARTRLSREVPALGRYPACAPGREAALMGLVDEFTALQSRIDALDARRRGRDTPLSESARLRVELRGLGEERDRLTGRIEELCDGR